MRGWNQFVGDEQEVTGEQEEEKDEWTWNNNNCRI